jgi:hypothetical protein
MLHPRAKQNPKQHRNVPFLTGLSSRTNMSNHTATKHYNKPNNPAPFLAGLPSRSCHKQDNMQDQQSVINIQDLSQISIKVGVARAGV